MEKFTHKGNSHEPDINLDAEKGMVEIKGRAIMVHASEFYQPIFEWVDKYVQSPAAETTINYHMDYYNSSCRKYLLDLLEKFTPLYKSGKKITFNWYYKQEDEEEMDAGILYGELSGLPVNLLSVPDE